MRGTSRWLVFTVTRLKGSTDLGTERSPTKGKGSCGAVAPQLLLIAAVLHPVGARLAYSYLQLFQTFFDQIVDKDEIKRL
jgi:hypothetical protein